MALCRGSTKQATWKLLKLCSSTIQAATISSKHFHVSHPTGDSKVKLRVKTPEVNLQNFVSALKQTDDRINTVEDIGNFRKVDWMKVSDPFFVSIVESWEEEQNALKQQLIVHDTEDWAKAIDGNNDKGIRGVEYIGGVDVSFVKEDPYKACAAYIIMKYPSMDLVYSDLKIFELTIPYICGFLAFREITPYQELIREQRQEHPEFGPDVIMVDGNGLLHSKGFGMACHLGVLIDVPCIGVTKNLLRISDIEMNEECLTQLKNLQKCGDSVPLVGVSGTVYGTALKSTDSTREIYVSSGHRVSLETAVQIVSRCCKYRIPEPIRLADHISRVRMREEHPVSSENMHCRKNKEVKDSSWLKQFTSRQFWKEVRAIKNKFVGKYFSKYFSKKRVHCDKKGR